MSLGPTSRIRPHLPIWEYWIRLQAFGIPSNLVPGNPEYSRCIMGASVSSYIPVLPHVPGGLKWSLYILREGGPNGAKWVTSPRGQKPCKALDANNLIALNPPKIAPRNSVGSKQLSDRQSLHYTHTSYTQTIHQMLSADSLVCTNCEA